MTKDEIVRRLEDACSHGGMVTEQLRYVTDAVAALDICTAAERELVEAMHEAWKGVTEGLSGGTRVDNALAAVLAERTPPDPLEAFVATIKCLYNVGDWADVARAISELDAARSKK